MDWISGISNAINYIEAHLTEELDYEQIAKESFSSSFHFQRVFSILCGYTLGEYIRYRRLTLAGAELASTRCKVIDVAYKYGYDTPESFSRAFQKFHGVSPSEARYSGISLKSFSPLSIKVSLEGGNFMQYRIEEKPAMTLTGYKRYFTGAPSNKENQDHFFACETRALQYLLHGMSRNHDDTYQVLTNFTPEGYDFYMTQPLPSYVLEDFDQNLGAVAKQFEHLSIPAGLYLVCETERCQYPCDLQEALRVQAVSQWLPSSGYQLRNAPEIHVIHWYYEDNNEKRNCSRYCELWLPIEKKDP